MVALTVWATVARFETHQGSLCPPSKCREARTGFDAVILLFQEKVVFDDALISRPEKSSLPSILTVVTYMKSGIFLLQGRARVKLFGAGQARGQGRSKGRSQDLRGGAMVKLRGRAFLGQVLPMFWGGTALFFGGAGRGSVKNLTGRPRPGQPRFFWAGTGRASPDSLSYLTSVI